MLAAIVAVGSAAIFALGALRGTPEPAFTEGPEVAAPAGAPDADQYVVLASRSVGAEDLMNIILDLGSQDEVDPEAIEYLAQATSSIGTTEILQWQELATPPDGQPELRNCQGNLSSYGSSGSGGAGCSPVDAPVTRPSFGRGATESDDDSIERATIFGADDSARWFVATTANGHRVVSNLVKNAGYVEWLSSSLGGPAEFVLLDESFAELWSSTS